VTSTAVATLPVPASTSLAAEKRDRLKLLIVIPALNEETSIESIIRRSLDARAVILAQSPVTAVDVTVVSDGSTDRTAELARKYSDQISVIVFSRNRGYGAAIQAAWCESDAELLGFLDADGTCDPCFFADLCNLLENEDADVVLGSRLNPDSQMPWIRQVGNVIFAGLVSMFSSRVVRDVASGMRVVRRATLPRLLPLPDGLHFTPAMSARAIMSDEVKIVEAPMPYRERDGESKLRISKDGPRFLKAILDAVFLYRPARPLALLGAGCLLAAAAVMVLPTFYYLQHRAVLEWMIYRFIVANLLGTTGCLLVGAGHLTRRITGLTVCGPPRAGHWGRPMRWWSWLVAGLLILAGGALVFPSFKELVTTGATYEHWSRFIAMSFLAQNACILIVIRLVDYCLDLIEAQLDYQRAAA